MSTRLVLLRHGQSQWNLENRFTDWHDVDLTEQGRIYKTNKAQAIEMAAAHGIKLN